MTEPVVYVSGGVAYEARGENLIIDFDYLKEAGISEFEQAVLEGLVEAGHVNWARAYQSTLLQRKEGA